MTRPGKRQKAGAAVRQEAQAGRLSKEQHGERARARERQSERERERKMEREREREADRDRQRDTERPELLGEGKLEYLASDRRSGPQWARPDQARAREREKARARKKGWRGQKWELPTPGKRKKVGAAVGEEARGERVIPWVQ